MRFTYDKIEHKISILNFCKRFMNDIINDLLQIVEKDLWVTKSIIDSY